MESQSRLSLREAARGGAARGDGVPPPPPHGRAPFPADDSILWVPRTEDGDQVHVPEADGPYEYFFSPAVLSGIASHVEGTRREARFGFLLGNVFRCPETGYHYSVIDAGIAATEPFSEEAPRAYLLRAWAAAQMEFRRHGGLLLGWYHSHYLLGMFLSEGDVETNRRYFSEPWQCSVLVVPDAERPLGGVFPSPVVQAEASQRSPAPFYEIVQTGADDEARTAVSWMNYQTKDSPVHEPGTGLIGDVSDGRLFHGGNIVEHAPLPAEASPAQSGDRLLTDSAEPGVGSLVLASAPPSGLFSRMAPAQWRAIGLTVLAVAALVATIFTIRGSTGPSAPPTPVEVPRPVQPGVQRFMQAGSGLEAATERYDERARDFDLGRIGCDLLRSGYASTDDAFVGMAAAYARLNAASDSREAVEYDRLVNEMNTVNEHFDASGCPRPQ
jgi:proteasome lid subunit RPN8/RPN11